MSFQYFPEALAQARQQLALRPEQFAEAAGLPVYEVTHLLAGEPLQRQNYQAIFAYFLGDKIRAPLAASLTQACLLEGLIERGLDVELAEQLAGTIAQDAAIAHLFKRLSILQQIALSTIGGAAQANEGVEGALFCLAELSRGITCDFAIAPGFFLHQMRQKPGSAKLFGGSLGDIISEIQPEDPPSDSQADP